MRRSSASKVAEDKEQACSYADFAREVGSMLEVDAGLSVALQHVAHDEFARNVGLELDVEAGLRAALASALPTLAPAEIEDDRLGTDPPCGDGQVRAEENPRTSLPRVLDRVRCGLYVLRLVSPLAWATKRTCRDAAAHLDTLGDGLAAHALGRDQAQSLVKEATRCVRQVRNSHLRFNSLRIFAGLTVMLSGASQVVAPLTVQFVLPAPFNLGAVLGLAFAGTAVLVSAARVMTGRLLGQLDYLRQYVNRLFDSADDPTWSRR